MSGKVCGLPLPKSWAWCKKSFKHAARLPASLQGPSCISARLESLGFDVWWMSVHQKGTWGFQILCRDSTGAQVLASELHSHIPTDEKFRLARCWPSSCREIFDFPWSPGVWLLLLWTLIWLLVIILELLQKLILWRVYFGQQIHRSALGSTLACWSVA